MEPLVLDLTKAVEVANGVLKIKVIMGDFLPGSYSDAISISIDKARSNVGMSLQFEFTQRSGPFPQATLELSPFIESSHSRDNIPSPVVSIFVKPNPFNALLNISIKNLTDLPVEGRVNIYDSRGRLLYQESVFANGDINLSWDGRDLQGKLLASGKYFVLFQNKSSNIKAITPVVLVK